MLLLQLKYLSVLVLSPRVFSLLFSHEERGFLGWCGSWIRQLLKLFLPLYDGLSLPEERLPLILSLH